MNPRAWRYSSCCSRSAVAAPDAHAAALRAGVGKADITPRTGYYLGGWTRADRVAQGPAHAPVLARARARARRPQGRARGGGPVHGPGRDGEARGRRAAPVAGFSERNILISASHTHSGPGGYANFPRFNTAAPEPQTRPPTRFASSGCFNPDARRPPALHVPRPPDHRGHPPRGRRPRRPPPPAGAPPSILGLTPQPQPRGPPGGPRHPARARPGQRGAGPRRLRPHDRPAR